MQNATIQAARSSEAPLAASAYTTNSAAARLGVMPNTLRVALCNNGHYLGIKPVKLPNRRLMWPAAQVEAVARGEAA